MDASLKYVAALAVAVVVVHLLKKFIKPNDRRRLPPSGPFAFPIIGHLYLLKQPLHQSLAKISARYGSILLLRFGSLPVLLVSSPELAEECFTTNDIVFANRPPLLFFQVMGYNWTSMVSAPYGPHWRNTRRIASLEIFSSFRINSLSNIRTAELNSLLRRLYRAGPTTVDLRSTFYELALNTMTKMIAGKSYFGDDATVGEEERGRFLQLMQKVFRLGLSNMEDFVPFLGYVSKINRRMEKVSREMEKVFQEMVDENKRKMESRSGGATSEVSEERKNIVEVMLELQRKEPESYTDEIIKSTIMNLILAGVETTSTTMEWAMALLLNHPTVLKKATEDIDLHVGKSRLVTDDDLVKLNYLQNIIKETMRLYPAGPLLVPHYSSDDCVVGGFNIPRGTMLVVHAYAIQRDPKLFPNPSEFRPERFEVADGENKMFPFGIGRRRCPGENLSLRTMGQTLGNLLQCFDWERISKEMVDLAEGEGLSMPLAKPLEAKCKPRPIMLDVLSQV